MKHEEVGYRLLEVSPEGRQVVGPIFVNKSAFKKWADAFMAAGGSSVSIKGETPMVVTYEVQAVDIGWEGPPMMERPDEMARAVVATQTMAGSDRRYEDGPMFVGDTPVVKEELPEEEEESNWEDCLCCGNFTSLEKCPECGVLCGRVPGKYDVKGNPVFQHPSPEEEEGTSAGAAPKTADLACPLEGREMGEVKHAPSAFCSICGKSFVESEGVYFHPVPERKKVPCRFLGEDMGEVTGMEGVENKCLSCGEEFVKREIDGEYRWFHPEGV